MKWIRRKPKWKSGDPVWVDFGLFPALYTAARKGVVLGVRTTGKILVQVDGRDTPVSVSPDSIWARHPSDFPQSQVES